MTHIAIIPWDIYSFKVGKISGPEKPIFTLTWGNNLLLEHRH